MANSSPSSEQVPDSEILLARWRNVSTFLLLRGFSWNRAATEAACVGALEAWELINGWRRRERALGSMQEARALEAALRSLQDIIVLLLHEPDDPHSAGQAVQTTWRTFGTDVALESRKRTAPRAAEAVGQIFRALEALLDGKVVHAA